jgi:hypothetical protein
MAKLTKSALLTKINTLLADNTNHDISEADMREVLTDMKDSLAYIEDDQKSGTAVSFSENSIYGTPAAPIAGAISLDVTNPLKGATALMLHQDALAPSFGPEFIELGDSMAYDTGKINYIHFKFITALHVIYSIKPAM